MNFKYNLISGENKYYICLKIYTLELPKSIEKCPIIDALVEIRFDTSVPSSAIFGIIYNELKDKYKNVENLPILQLPESVRNSDPNLKFKPFYRISNDKFVVQIGPDVLTIGSYPIYQGWDVFSKEIFNIIEKLNDLNIIDSFYRLALRYINFFEENIFRNIDLKILMRNNEIEYKNTVLRTEIEHNLFKSSVQIANNANHSGRNGSIIDIDTHLEHNLQDFFNCKEELLNNAHYSEKQLFYSLLNKSFLKKLNPIY